jgi:hypothetical protein
MSSVSRCLSRDAAAGNILELDMSGQTSPDREVSGAGVVLLALPTRRMKTQVEGQRSMGRGKAAFTQADVCRILNAANKTGVAVHVTLPGGIVIQALSSGVPTTAGDVTAANDNSVANDFEDFFNDQAAAQVR